ncbi:hypothetical protein [Nonomuraea fuscirosea]|uniref:hypothetical protein n=1 Tax=Nonomuraea fuscirosea TaxID=1291556 RepID=UPI0033DD6DA8
MPDKTRNLLPEQQQPGEDQSAFHQRRRPWDAMTHAGTEIKTCRSRVATALDTLRGQLSGPSAYPVPDSQRARVQEWEQKLSVILFELDTIDVDAWKSAIRDEITYQPEQQ